MRSFLLAAASAFADGRRLADINSAFIQIGIVLFPENVPGFDPAELRALLPVYLDSFFTLPVTRADGTKLDFEEVVKQLDAETLSYSININSPLQEAVTLRMKVSKDKYATAIAWLSDLLYNSTFSAERLKISATKALQGIPSEKRDGSEVSYAAYRKMISEEVSTNVALNLLNREQFLPAFLERLKVEPEVVVKQLEAFRQGCASTDSLLSFCIAHQIRNSDGPARNSCPGQGRHPQLAEAVVRLARALQADSAFPRASDRMDLHLQLL